jgi:hypothetical protein
MTKPALLLAALGLLAPSCSMASDTAWAGLHAHGYGGMMLLSSEGSLDDVSSTVGGADVSGAVDFDSADDSVLVYGARVGIAPFELVFADVAARTENGGTFAAGGTFAGNTLTADLASTTTLDLAVRKLLLGIDLLATDQFRLGLLVGVDEVSFDEVSVTAAEDALLGLIQAGDREVVLSDENVFVPMVGVRADLQLPIGLRLGGELSGISVDTSDVKVSYFDFDGNLNYAITENIEALAGYRYVTVDVDGSFDGTTFNSNLDLSGPYVALGIVF